MIPRKRLFVLVPACIAAAAFWPTDVAAQRRVVRRAPVRTVIVGAYAYPRYSYPYFYDPFWWGWSGYYPQYRPYPPYPPYGYGYAPVSELRIQVTPRQAEVYVDGYLTGTVDDFDGVFQRLRMPLGEHEVTIYLPGYRTISQRMLFRPYESYHIKETMQPLAAGDSLEPRPVPAERPPSQGAPGRGAPVPVERERVERDRMERGERNPDRFGSIAIRVQPADASVFIDDQRWDAPAGDDRLQVQLSEGTHRVEVRKEGYKPYTSTVRIRSGETIALNISLPLTEGKN